LGEDHPDAAITLNNLGEAQRGMGQLSTAEQSLNWAAAIAKSVLGEGHPNNGIFLNNLAGVYHYQGRFAESERNFERALEILQAGLNRGHPPSPGQWNNLQKALAQTASLIWRSRCSPRR